MVRFKGIISECLTPQEIIEEDDKRIIRQLWTLFDVAIEFIVKELIDYFKQNIEDQTNDTRDNPTVISQR